MPTRTSGLPNELARQLLAFEAAKGGAAKSSPAFLVCEKMRGPLGKLLGVDGFRSLVARSLAMASAEVAWLRGIRIEADGVLRDDDETRAKLGPAEVQYGETTFVAELLGLLVIFVGSYLTEQLLHGIWPKLRSLNSKNGGVS